jgi:hypothetical protein
VSTVAVPLIPLPRPPFRHPSSPVELVRHLTNTSTMERTETSIHLWAHRAPLLQNVVVLRGATLFLSGGSIRQSLHFPSEVPLNGRKVDRAPDITPGTAFRVTLNGNGSRKPRSRKMPILPPPPASAAQVLMVKANPSQVQILNLPTSMVLGYGHYWHFIRVILRHKYTHVNDTRGERRYKGSEW